MSKQSTTTDCPKCGGCGWLADGPEQPQYDCPDCKGQGARTAEVLMAQPTPALCIAYDGTLGHPWTVVVRRWDAKATAWAGIATCGQIASSAEHAVALVKQNGPWPEGAEFIAHEPGAPLGALVWGEGSVARS